MATRGSRRQLLVPGAEQALEQFKYEVAQEFGIKLGAEQYSRANGSVGGEIVKRLIAQAQSELKGQ
ncbi:alpha/beta-type small acid-soluble spore protein [Bacillus sp. V5-8f]|uniref:alpha/beta-type small acid-soluble spore protein n=1 Tax=Bacillus sp. V5-8f TaxID=2053044 RepID=UPI000C78F274|nr:alpha/beta-type small acid-soluble spore protein [Bacillus sp. V5-8f]PLT34412.1 small, acid-soluble spore protein, alpha/beta type [Bacillus sp. V5-8f]